MPATPTPSPSEPIPMLAHLIEKCKGQEQYITKLEEALKNQNQCINTIRNALASIAISASVVEENANVIMSALHGNFASLK